MTDTERLEKAAGLKAVPVIGGKDPEEKEEAPVRTCPLLSELVPAQSVGGVRMTLAKVECHDDCAWYSPDRFCAVVEICGCLMMIACREDTEKNSPGPKG